MRPELAEAAQKLAQVSEDVAKYPPKFQTFMEHFLLPRVVLPPKRDGWAYGSYQDLVMDLGQLGRATPQASDELLALVEPQHCYKNCYEATLEHPDEYTYVEGYAQTNMLVVHHAWLLGRNGEIVDPTWGMPAFRKGQAEIGWKGEATYFGIRFSSDFVFRRALETGQTGVMHDWQDGVPSLHYGFEVDESGLVVGYNKEVA